MQNDDQRYSIIKAFNIVHGALVNVWGEGASRLDYIIDEECEKAGKPAANMEITIRPLQDLLKQARYLNAGKNAVTLLAGPLKWAGYGATMVFSFWDIVTSDELWSVENMNPAEAIGNVLYHIYKRGEEDLLGKVLGGYSTIATCLTILQDIIYKSYAAFVGEIKIKVSTYCEQYEFKGNYNFEGMLEGDYTVSSQVVQKSMFTVAPPEDNKTTIRYKIYEDGMFQVGEEKSSCSNLKEKSHESGRYFDIYILAFISGHNC